MRPKLVIHENVVPRSFKLSINIQVCMFVSPTTANLTPFSPPLLHAGVCTGVCFWSDINSFLYHLIDLLACNLVLSNQPKCLFTQISFPSSPLHPRGACRSVRLRRSYNSSSLLLRSMVAHTPPPQPSSPLLLRPVYIAHPPLQQFLGS